MSLTKLVPRRRLILALGLVAIGAGLVFLPYAISPDSYRGQIIRQVEQRLGRSVTLGSLSLRSLPSVRIEASDGVIGDDPQYAKGAFVAAKSVRLGIDLWSLLRGRLTVHSLELVEPAVTLIRANDETWNWSTLRPLQSTEPGTQRAPIDIDIRNGRFTVIDRSRSPNSEHTYLGVDFAIHNFASQSVSPFTLDITMPGQNGGRLRIKGSIGPIDPTGLARSAIEAQLKVDKADLPSLEALLGQSSARAGNITLDAKVKGSLAKEIEARGELSGQNLRFTEGSAPTTIPLVANFEISVAAQQGSGYGVKIAQADLKLGKTRTSITGEINHLPNEPALDLHFRGEQVSLDGLLESVHAIGLGPPAGTSASGQAGIDIRATGPLKALALTGQAEIREVKLQRSKSAETIRIPELKLRLDSASISASPFSTILGKRTSVEITSLMVRNYTQKPRAHLEVAVHNAPLDDLLKIGQSFGYQPNLTGTGVASLEAAIETDIGDTVSPAHISGKGNLTSARLEFLRFTRPLEISAADLSFSGESLRIAIGRLMCDNFVATDLKSQLVRRGEILDVNPLTFTFFGGQYQGQMRIDLSERNSNLTVNGQFGGVDVNQFLSSDPTLKNVVYGHAKGTMNLRTQARRLDAKSMLGSGRIIVTDGRFASFELPRQMEILGRITGLPTGGVGTEFRSLTTDFRFENGRIFAENLRLEMNDITVTGHGVLNLSEPLTTDFELLTQLTPSLSRRVLPQENITSIVGNFFMDQNRLSVPLKMSGLVTRPSFYLNAEVLQKQLAERLTRRPDQTLRGIFDLLKPRVKETALEEKKP